MRAPTPAEVAAIKAHPALCDYEYTTANIGVIERYMPDGPGWSGRLAVCVGGECGLSTTVLFNADGTVRQVMFGEAQ